MHIIKRTKSSNVLLRGKLHHSLRQIHLSAQLVVAVVHYVANQVLCALHVVCPSCNFIFHLAMQLIAILPRTRKPFLCLMSNVSSSKIDECGYIRLYSRWSYFFILLQRLDIFKIISYFWSFFSLYFFCKYPAFYIVRPVYCCHIRRGNRVELFFENAAIFPV